MPGFLPGKLVSRTAAEDAHKGQVCFHGGIISLLPVCCVPPLSVIRRPQNTTGDLWGEINKMLSPTFAMGAFSPFVPPAFLLDDLTFVQAGGRTVVLLCVGMYFNFLHSSFCFVFYPFFIHQSSTFFSLVSLSFQIVPGHVPCVSDNLFFALMLRNGVQLSRARTWFFFSSWTPP